MSVQAPQHADTVGQAPSKLPYQTPSLREFGALHQFTQGTKTAGNDANGTKTRNAR